MLKELSIDDRHPATPAARGQRGRLPPALSQQGREGARCALSINDIEYISQSAGKYVNVLQFD